MIAAGTDGSALEPQRFWKPLPSWAIRFAAQTECPHFEVLSGEQAFALLVESL
jgi:hypothetical protein